MAEIYKPEIIVVIGDRSALPREQLQEMCRRCPVLVQALALTATDRFGGAQIICSMEVLTTSYGVGNKSVAIVPDEACTVKAPEHLELMLPNYIPPEVPIQVY